MTWAAVLIVGRHVAVGLPPLTFGEIERRRLAEVTQSEQTRTVPLAS